MITAQNNTHFKPPGIYSEHTRTKHERNTKYLRKAIAVLSQEDMSSTATKILPLRASGIKMWSSFCVH